MGRGIWFLNTLVHIRISEADSEDGLSVIEHRAPFADSPPLHLHQTEDEVFHILEGELRLRVDEQTILCRPGDIVLAPRGVPHTYRVESAKGGRWVTITAHGDFERFVRSLGREAEYEELPPAVSPSPEQIAELTTKAAKFGIVIVGPPLG
jgi:quercetin dioxygenase-like cupin family protein